MIRYLVTLFLVMLFFQDADAQWYYRQFGVHSMDQLSKSQLELSLKYLLHQRKNTAIAYGVAIPACAATGALMIHRANNYGADEGSGMVAALGATLVAVSVFGLVPVAIGSLTAQSVRISKVKKALGNPDLTFQLYNQDKFPITGHTTMLPTVGVKMTFNF